MLFHKIYYRRNLILGYMYKYSSINYQIEYWNRFYETIVWVVWQWFGQLGTDWMTVYIDFNVSGSRGSRLITPVSVKWEILMNHYLNKGYPCLCFLWPFLSIGDFKSSLSVTHAVRNGRCHLAKYSDTFAIDMCNLGNGYKLRLFSS